MGVLERSSVSKTPERSALEEPWRRRVAESLLLWAPQSRSEARLWERRVREAGQGVAPNGGRAPGV